MLSFGSERYSTPHLAPTRVHPVKSLTYTQVEFFSFSPFCRFWQRFGVFGYRQSQPDFVCMLTKCATRLVFLVDIYCVSMERRSRRPDPAATSTLINVICSYFLSFAGMFRDGKVVGRGLSGLQREKSQREDGDVRGVRQIDGGQGTHFGWLIAVLVFIFHGLYCVPCSAKVRESTRGCYGRSSLSDTLTPKRVRKSNDQCSERSSRETFPTTSSLELARSPFPV